MNIGIIPHTGKPAAISLKNWLTIFGSLISTFGLRNSTAFRMSRITETNSLEDLDVVIVLGGDGALLNASV